MSITEQEIPIQAAPMPLATPPLPPEPEKRRVKKRVVAAVILVVAALIGLFWGVPELIYMFNHVSTDDAAVNSHLTYVSPRVDGVALKVLVDDNQFVQAGTLLVQLDDVPFRLAVEQKQAALDLAKTDVAEKVAALEQARAELEQAKDQARSQLAGLHGAWFLATTVLDFVHYESAGLQANVDNLKLQRANLDLANIELKNAQATPAGVSAEEIEQRQSAVEVAKDQVASADASIQQTRALLELSPAQEGQNPAEVPSDVAEHFAGTQYVLSSLQQDADQLGLPTEIVGQKLSELKDRLMNLTADEAITNSPAVRAAAAKVDESQAALGGPNADPANHPEIVQAQKDLEDAQLQLSYTQIRAPITGYVNRRSVNPGTHVEAGQDLLVIRSLSDVWIDADFKETQLSDLRIGQPVEIRVDAYPGRVFHGRVAGFSPGTGSVESLLPPENATGNYVKVVQRVTVRIELTEPNPPDMPLLAGLSVEPEVDIKAEPTGPGAGMRLLPAAVTTP